MLSIPAPNFDSVPPNARVSMRCPKCRQQGTFDAIGINDVRIIDSGRVTYVVGQRRCPKPTCYAHVFMVLAPNNGAVVASYPPERFDFEPTGIPERVLKAFEEATACHALGAYTAAAMMVRKTLELLCIDRGATGGNLKEKIRNLGARIIIPTDLLQGIDDLRLLGNDAAHVEAQTYDDVGKDEVDVAFELTKEVLKATFQYASLLGRLKALKKTP